MQKIFLTLLFFLSIHFLVAQELLCEVNVVATPKNKNTVIQTDPKVFKTLESQIIEFMNNTKWTSEIYKEEEKIDCSIFLTITSESGSTFSGRLQVVSKRPVYNSEYQTTVVSIIDNDIKFTYKEFEPIEIAENQFVNNLSHILSFYANIIIAMDNETFAKNGGETYLQKALEVVNVVSSQDGKRFPGWKSFDKNKRSRYWLITNLLNPRFENFREAQYLYYREGLDNFYKEDVLARKNIKKALELLAKVSLDDPNISIMQMWSETKSKEMIDIFKDAPKAEKNAILNILRKVDPVNAEKYNVISK